MNKLRVFCVAPFLSTAEAVAPALVVLQHGIFAQGLDRVFTHEQMYRVFVLCPFKVFFFVHELVELCPHERTKAAAQNSGAVLGNVVVCFRVFAAGVVGLSPVR